MLLICFLLSGQYCVHTCTHHYFCTRVEDFTMSMVQGRFYYEICTPERRGGEKGGSRSQFHINRKFSGKFNLPSPPPRRAGLVGLSSSCPHPAALGLRRARCCRVARPQLFLLFPHGARVQFWKFRFCAVQCKAETFRSSSFSFHANPHPRAAFYEFRKIS